MSIASNPYKKVVIDTSPLIDALAIDLIARKPELKTLMSRHSHLTDYLERDPRLQQRLLDLLDTIEEIVITPNVIGEIRSKRYLKPISLHKAYWENCMEFFRRHNVREVLVPLSDLEQNEGTKRLTCEFGPTDAGLMVLASREKCSLLTNDDRWYAWQPVFGKLEIKQVRPLLEG